MPTAHPTLFLGRYPDLARAAAGQVADALDRRGPLGQPVELIVASRAAGEAIMRHVTSIRGGAVAGVMLRSPESLATEILARAGRLVRVATREEQTIAMQLASRSSKAELFQAPGISSALLRSYRDIRDAGVQLDELDSKIAKARLNDRERVREAARIFREYENLITRAGAADPADLFLLASRELKSGVSAGNHILYGFYDATGVQLAFFSALAMRSAVSTVFAPVPSSASLDDAYAFASSFIVAVRTWSGEQIELPGTSATAWDIAVHDTVRDEATAVMAAVRSAVDAGTKSRDIAVVLRNRDERERARFARAAAEYGLALNEPAGRPLHSTPIVRGVRIMLSIASNRFHRRDVIELLRCGLKLPKSLNSEWLDRVTRQARIGGGTSTQLRQIRSDKEYLQRGIDELTAVVEHLESVVQKVRPTASGTEWRQILRTFSESFLVETELDLASIDAIRSIGDTLATIAPDSAITLQAVDELIRECGDTTNDSAILANERIWFGDVMRFRGRPAKLLFVAGMADEIFPQRRSEDPLLRDGDRTLLGVRVIGDGRAEEQLLFEMLCDSAEEVRLSWARTNAEDRAQRPSSLLRELALSRDPANAATITRRFQQYVESRRSADETHASITRTAADRLLASLDTAALRQLRSIAAAGTQSAYDGYLTPSADLSDAVARRFAVIRPTHLEQMGECPHKFFYSALLKLEETDDPDVELELEIRKKGTVDHEILERFYREMPRDAIANVPSGRNRPLAPDLRQRLIEIVDQRFDELDANEPPNNRVVRAFERAAAKTRLANFVAADLKQLHDSGFEPFEYELAFDTAVDQQQAKIPAGGIDIAIRGIIDRVDRLKSTGEIRIVDYKSGKGQRYKKLSDQIESGKKLQLALYALVIEKIYGIPAEKIFGVIRPIAAPEGTDANFGFNLAELKEPLIRNLETFVHSATAGLFPAKPGDECRYCLMREWCRAAHDDEEIRAASRYSTAVEMLEDALS